MKRERITNILLFVIALLLVANIFIALEQSGVVDVKIQTALKQHADSIKIPEPIKPKDGYTPRKGVDYFDGQPGHNASSAQVEVAVEEYFKKNPVKNGKSGTNGKTPEVACNEEKNRWEVRYGLEEAWQLMGGKSVKCTTEAE